MAEVSRHLIHSTLETLLHWKELSWEYVRADVCLYCHFLYVACSS